MEDTQYENFSGNDSWLLINENLSDVQQYSHYWKHSLQGTIVFIVMYFLIFVSGMIGNGMVILVIWRKPQMRTVTNMFILNLAVADLLVIMVCVPPTLTATIFTSWMLGSFMCKAMTYVQGVSVFASAYSLVSISLDRCQGVYRPMRRGQGLSHVQATILISLVWVTAFLITSPWLFVFKVVELENSDVSYCLEMWGNEQHEKYYYIVVNLVSCYGLPLFLISLANLFIWWKVSRRKLPQNSASISNISVLHRRTRNEVRRMLTLVTFVFLVSWLPLYVVVTRIKLFKSVPIGEQETEVLNVFIPLAQLLGSWNSSVNPIIYAFLNSNFRKMFKSLLTRQQGCSIFRESRDRRFRNSTISASGGANNYSLSMDSSAEPTRRSSFIMRNVGASFANNASVRRNVRQRRPNLHHANICTQPRLTDV